MKPGPDADRVLLAHMRDCLDRIREYTNAERSRFDASRLVQDAVIRNLQTLAESNQRLSVGTKGAEPQIPWRKLAGFRNVIVHGYLGVDLAAVWLVVASSQPSRWIDTREPVLPSATPCATGRRCHPGRTIRVQVLWPSYKAPRPVEHLAHLAQRSAPGSLGPD